MPKKVLQPACIKRKRNPCTLQIVAKSARVPVGVMDDVAVLAQLRFAGHRPTRAAGSGAASPAPIFLGFARDRGRCRVLDLYPAASAAGVVRRADTLRHNALAAERAGALVEDRPLAAVVLAESNAVLCST